MHTATDSAARRLAIYERLRQRNRLVSILRVGLPVLGVLVALIFTAQILIASIGSRFGIGRISFNGDTVTVDAPTYSGVMADGDIYTMSAEAAATAITNLNVIDLKNLRLVLTKPDGTVMTARAATGSFLTLSQVMRVPGSAEVVDSTGNSGTLDDVVVDLPHQTLTARGRVQISLAGGRHIDGSGLLYDARTDVWTFGKSTLTLPDTPGNEEAN